MINELSRGRQSFKYQLLSVFLDKLIPLIEDRLELVELRDCRLCGYPSSGEVCSRCRRIAYLKNALSQRGEIRGVREDSG